MKKMTENAPNHLKDVFSEQEQKVIHSIRTSRIILPVLLGIAVVGYLMYRKFDPEEFAKIEWTRHTLSWVLGSFLFLGLKHFSYMTRLRILTKGAFSWRKCFELIVIWEFSSAISPTSVGGSAVALLVLSQEKLSTAKTTAIVIYTIVLDTLFFAVSLPIFYAFLRSSMIAPSASQQGWGTILLAGYATMAGYGMLFSYGLMFSPFRLKQFLLFVCRLTFLQRYRTKAEQLGNEIMIASQELRQESWNYHVGAFVATIMAWTSRFLLINCLIIALVASPLLTFSTQILLYARLESMFVITLLSPTPGAAGLAEFVFGQFLSDFVPPTRAIAIAIIWRLMTYYSYLLAGIVIVPNWVRERINERHLLLKKKE